MSANPEPASPDQYALRRNRRGASGTYAITNTETGTVVAVSRFRSVARRIARLLSEDFRINCAEGPELFPESLLEEGSK